MDTQFRSGFLSQFIHALFTVLAKLRNKTASGECTSLFSSSKILLAFQKLWLRTYVICLSVCKLFCERSTFVLLIAHYKVYGVHYTRTNTGGEFYIKVASMYYFFIRFLGTKILLQVHILMLFHSLIAWEQTTITPNSLTLTLYTSW